MLHFPRKSSLEIYQIHENIKTIYSNSILLKMYALNEQFLFYTFRFFLNIFVPIICPVQN